MSQTVTSATDHPLDPLSAEEFSAVAAILRRDREVDGGRRRLADRVASRLVEPGKAELADIRGGRRARRRAGPSCSACTAPTTPPTAAWSR